MLKEYSFDYDMMEAEVVFLVDTTLFTPYHAQSTLDFFTWDYDKEADPVDEVMKKYAIQAIVIATENSYNEYGVIKEFAELEGFVRIDGSMGITLTHVQAYTYDANKLDVSIKEIS